MDETSCDTIDAQGIAQKRRADVQEGQPGFKLRQGIHHHDKDPKLSVIPSDPNLYNMSHKSRGMAVIINNRDFQPHTHMGTRRGTDEDAEQMYKLFKTLGFETVIRHDNLTVYEMEEKLFDVAKWDHTENDCFVCAILTHGEDGFLFGIDGKIPVEDLVKYFRGHNCPSLAGKPKLFFIQACRGMKLDEGVDVRDAHGGDDSEEEEEEYMDEGEIIRRIPREADFLMAYSVISGYYAWRNVEKGSWFIQAVVDVFTENWENLDVLTMLTRVNRKVAYDFMSNNGNEYFNGKKQIPCVTSMLTKDMYFRKK